MQAESDTSGAARPSPPRVRCIMATHGSEPWFDRVVDSLLSQDYPRLSVAFVHGPGERRSLERWSARVASLELIEATANAGFGKKMNLGAAIGDDELLLLCHDDVILDPGTVSALVREWLRRGDVASIVGPKLVGWTDPATLMPAGFEADRFGETLPIVRAGELDQGQQDRSAETFGTSTACLLVSRDFFDRLGGFDEAMDWGGEDHDFALRSRLAGASVVVIPGASVRHRAGIDRRGGPPMAPRLRRHGMRSALVADQGFALARLLFLFAALHVVQFAVAVSRLELSEIRSIPGAWFWNLRHLGSLRRQRERVAANRQLDAERLRLLRRGGSISLSESFDARISQRERASELGESTLSVVRGAGSVVLGAFLLFGARHLLTRPIPAVGEFRHLPSDVGVLTADWWSGWRAVGMGTEGFAPFALLLLDVAGLLTLGIDSLLRLLLVVAPVPIGVAGMWRLFSRVESDRAPVAAAFVYAAAPMPYNAISGGSFHAMLLYALLPWIFGHLVGVAGGEVLSRTVSRASSTMGLLTLLALIGAFFPWVGVTWVVVLVGCVFGSLLAGDMRGVPAMIGASVVALAGAALLNLPHLAGIDSMERFASSQVSAGSSLTLVQVMTQATGPVGSVILGWAVLAPAFLAVLSGRGTRFTWAMRCWGVVLVSWTLTWSAARGWLPFGVPVDEVLLAPAVLGLAALVGLGAMVIDADLAGARARAMLPAVVGVIGFFLAMVPLIDGSLSGRWELARADLSDAYGTIEATPEEGSYRVLWIGDAHVLGSASTATERALAFTTSIDGPPDFRAIWGTTPGEADQVLAEAVDAGLDGRTSRLGRELARFGVRYIVVMDQQAKVPEVSRRVPVVDSAAAGLAAQLDLVRTGVVNPAISVYENTAWVPLHAAVAPAALTNLRLDDPAPILADRAGPASWQGQVRSTRNVYAAWQPSPRWSLTLGGQVAPRIDLGSVGMGFETAGFGNVSDANLSYTTPDSHRFIVVAQSIIWLLVALVWRWTATTNRRRSRTAGVWES